MRICIFIPVLKKNTSYHPLDVLEALRVRKVLSFIFSTVLNQKRKNLRNEAL